MTVLKGQRLAIKIVLSIFIVYHLAAVLILPNGSSLLGRKLARFLTPYANTLALNASWIFFSPAPTPMFTLEYEVEMADGTELHSAEVGADGEPAKFQFPPQRKDLFDDGYSRRLTLVRFFSINDERVRRNLIPYLCRSHPGARSISIRPVVERVPDLETAGLDSNSNLEGEKEELPGQTFYCEENQSGSAE